jgi:L,D-transpeptidase ErfK/SrfK
VFDAKDRHNTAMTFGRCRLGVAINVLTGSLIACAPLVWAQATPAAAAQSTPAAATSGQMSVPTESTRFAVNPNLNDEVVGEVQVTQTTEQDTLADIARRFSVGYNEIHRANPGVDMWVPGAGRRVVIPTQFVLPDAPHVGIVVNIAQMRLYYFPPRTPGGKQVVYTYPIGIGRVNWKTPSGVTTVVRKMVNPVWRPPADVGVGMRVSHGCMHLYPEDILQLYDLVPLGTPVRVVNQPFVFGWHRGDLYMQAFGPLEGDQRNWQDRTLLEQAMGPDIPNELQARDEQVHWDLVLQLAGDPQGIPVAITDSNASLDEVLANARQVQNRSAGASDSDQKP